MASCELEELQYLDHDYAHAKEDLLRHATEFKKAREMYAISEEDKDIDRLIYKLNFSRALTMVLLSKMELKTLEDAQNLMDTSRKLARPRNKEFYEKRITKRLNESIPPSQ